MMETKSKQGRSNYISSCELEGGKAHNSSPPPNFIFMTLTGERCQPPSRRDSVKPSSRQQSLRSHPPGLHLSSCTKSSPGLAVSAPITHWISSLASFLAILPDKLFFYSFFFSLQANLPSTKLVSWIQRGETENNLYLNQGGDVVFLRRSVGELKRGPLTRRH